MDRDSFNHCQLVSWRNILITMTEAQQEAWSQGRDACLNTDGDPALAKNPYTHKSEEWMYWNRGWNSVTFQEGEEVGT